MESGEIEGSTPRARRQGIDFRRHDPEESLDGRDQCVVSKWWCIVPVAFERVRNPLADWRCENPTGQASQGSREKRNDAGMIVTCVNNALKFRDVLMNSWFAATENFDFIVKKEKAFYRGTQVQSVGGVDGDR